MLSVSRRASFSRRAAGSEQATKSPSHQATGGWAGLSVAREAEAGLLHVEIARGLARERALAAEARAAALAHEAEALLVMTCHIRIGLLHN